jgi:ATP adenylyltransferase
MQTIWAPWRIAYILSEKAQGCFLCQKARQVEYDDENFVLCRRTHAFVLMNMYPYNNGHLMIAPYAHVSSLTELQPHELQDVFCLAQLCESVLARVIQPEGFNMGINLGKVAGAGVEDHLHLHIVPRWHGDTNYMTAISETRVIPQQLEETYGLLRAGFLLEQK